ncbi:endonuclease MutS2 [Oceanidesulfovibrio marinus]|uniref:Endonuclease MutS2 n=1 Tax=Oceanidesulfovibrio marinus TaxID=370038 RepID=A0A6P1ZJC9_9BACT|nr:Smr/MutS family protein [Oceanidesulfovibrio marinus]QJT08206.1 endonuclease MutS2 [Oceanidesulfovibrio marinus]TVM35101.1 endonuclease MutS2 [Oceanidesulfovibrio marinus]
MNERTLKLLEFPSVLSLLAKHAMSEPGREACLALGPYPDVQTVSRENRVLAEAFAWFGESEHKPTDFPPLEGLFDVIEEGRSHLDLDDLSGLKATLAEARRSLDVFGTPEAAAQTGRDLRWPLLAGEAWAVRFPEKTWSGLRRCLSEQGHLKDESSPELMAARAGIREVHKQCIKRVKAYVLDNNLTNYLQDDYVTISSDRYVLPLKASYKTKLPGIIHDYSQTGETCYFEPLFLVEINNQAQEIRQEERAAEREVLRLLTSFARDEYDQLKACYELLIRLDVLHSKVGLGAQLDALPLEVAPGAPIVLNEVRHPLLAADPRAKATSLDIVMEQQHHGLVVSGGNAGGKTVCLKTLGLSALMAMSGLPVPAAEGSTLPLWERLYVFMGDEQSLADHVSTFTAQIERLSGLLPSVTETTLVLLDEFGAGTDPAQGAALAQAVIEDLLERGATVAAATHFPALKVFALTDDRVRAASVLFDPATKKPLYKLAFDQVGQSQALEAAREHGLPESVLARAESILNPNLPEGVDPSRIMDRLNALAVNREAEVSGLRQERKKLKDREARLRERFEKDKDKLFEEVRAASRRILREWQERKVSHKQAMRELAEARDKVRTTSKEGAAEQAGPERAVAFEDFEKGQAIRYLPWAKKAVVEELDSKRKLLKVDISGVSLWAKPEDAVPMEQGGQPAPQPIQQSAKQSAKQQGKAASGAGSMRLDLRGKRGDEAVAELGKVMDNALMRNVAQIEVVHGKGTGALRREVHSFLEHSPAVASFDLADEEHGGDGMTLVELK